jgi:hypothetical protein
MIQYRIEFTIQGQGPDDEDYADIGFGSSCGWDSIDAALYEVDSIVQNRMWETTPDMPEPLSVLGDESKD